MFAEPLPWWRPCASFAVNITVIVITEEALTRVVCRKAPGDGELKQWAENGSLEMLEVVAQKPLEVNSATIKEAWEPVPKAVFQEAQEASEGGARFLQPVLTEEPPLEGSRGLTATVPASC